MSIEEEINAIIDNSPNYDAHVTYPHAELCAYVRAYAVQELEQLPKLIARIKDQENTPEYLVVDAREIARAIARLDKDVVDAVVRRMRLRLQELRHQRSLRHKPNN